MAFEERLRELEHAKTDRLTKFSNTSESFLERVLAA